MENNIKSIQIKSIYLYYSGKYYYTLNLNIIIIIDRREYNQEIALKGDVLDRDIKDFSFNFLLKNGEITESKIIKEINQIINSTKNQLQNQKLAIETSDRIIFALKEKNFTNKENNKSFIELFEKF